MTLHVFLAYSVSAALIAVSSCELANDFIERQPRSNEAFGQNELFHFDKLRAMSGPQYKELAKRSSEATVKEDKDHQEQSPESNLDDLGFEVGDARWNDW